LSKYDGIHPEGLLLLAETQFRDSKEFYDQHKPELHRLAITPLRQIVEGLTEDLTALDPQMNLVPSRIVSRIRRDTRFSNNKRLYRANLWITLMRPKSPETLVYPCLWFEMYAVDAHWNCGICIYETPPAYMAFVRQKLGDAAEAQEFLAAEAQVRAAGALPEFARYKKDRVTNVSPELLPYCNTKQIVFTFSSPNMALLTDGRILDELRRLYRAYGPMYRILLRWAEEYQTIS
jgi:uncharacterized protein (DUF2461 family)